MSVSIVTITQYGRFECLEILSTYIENQTYKKIIEWIIVEGSQTEETAKKNKEYIEKLITQTKINIKYIPYDGNQILGKLRNKSNDASSGDFIVCMDDDDYYPFERVEHAVKTLRASKNLIAGCSGCMFYDYILDKQFKSNVIGPNHSTNNSIAYKKEYLKNHKYDDTKTFAEESSFTNNFTEPMCQLTPKKTVIVSSHGVNTYNKRKLMMDAITGRGAIRESATTIPSKCYKAYKKIFRVEETSKYDIVYMCGYHSINWNPSDQKLGGSEQAVVNLSSHWKSKGYSVAVYGNIPTMSYNGVDFYPYEMFPFHHKFNIIIIWRLFGIYGVYKTQLKANKIFWDLHDNMKTVQNIKDVYSSHCSKIDYYMFKSQYHRDEFEQAISEKLENNKCKIIMNGIRIDKFENVGNFERNKYRFCYCSCYTRGLEVILKHVWPIIYSHEPRAELHVYYGLNGHPEFKTMMQQLLSTPGVMDHGRQDVNMINREKHLSTFHIYLSSSPSEIDCISVRESLVAGCIPILSNFGVFKQRHGFHFDMNTQEQILSVGNKILDLLKLEDDKIEQRRNLLYKSNTIISWENSGDEWIKDF